MYKNMEQRELVNKKVIYNLKIFGPLILTAEYFDIIKFKDKYFLYFTYHHKLNLVISKTLNFVSKKVINTIVCPHSTFSFIVEGNYIYMLCGGQITIKSPNEIKIPTYHILGTKYTTVLPHYVKRNDRRNGVYLLRSTNGIDWESLHDKPVMHLFVESKTCRLGECAYDTRPVLIKHNNEYIYYGRLNTGHHERHIYYRKSHDLINWGPPHKINIFNENKTIIDGKTYDNNYYNLAIFKYKNLIYAFVPYFEAYKNEQWHFINSKTILMKSENGIDWEIINSYLPIKEKYDNRVCSVFVDKDKINVFFREYILKKNQNLVSYDFNFKYRKDF